MNGFGEKGIYTLLTLINPKVPSVPTFPKSVFLVVAVTCRCILKVTVKNILNLAFFCGSVAQVLYVSLSRSTVYCGRFL